MEDAQSVTVVYKLQKKEQTLYELKRDGPTLLGRDCLKEIKSNWQLIGMVSAVTKCTEVFQEGVGAINTFTAKVQLKQGYKPNFLKARPVPFSFKQAVECELDRLETG